MKMSRYVSRGRGRRIAEIMERDKHLIRSWSLHDAGRPASTYEMSAGYRSSNRADRVPIEMLGDIMSRQLSRQCTQKKITSRSALEG